jgi:hypothetical protein
VLQLAVRRFSPSDSYVVLPQRPFDVQTVRLGTLHGRLSYRRIAKRTYSPLMRFRAARLPQLRSSGPSGRQTGPGALGNHFPLLLRERCPDMQSEVVATLPELCDYEVHPMLHESTDEVHIAR